MNGKEITSLKKKQFALEYYKNGKNAAKAAEAVGYSKKTAAQRGYQLLKDKTVIATMHELDEIFSLDKMSQPDKDVLNKDVADITELLQRLTDIIRRKETEDNVVVLKSETQTFDGVEKTTVKEQNIEIVKTRARLSDVNKAIDILMRYYSKPDANEDNDGESGVVILPEVK